MVDLVTMRDGQKLVPATAFDVLQLEKCSAGKPLATVVTHSRSVKHNRWYRGLIGVVAEGLGLHPDTLHAELKFKAGFVRRILMVEAGVMVELDSCAFNTMDQARFTEYVEIAVEILFSHYLPRVKRSDVYWRVEKLVGPRPR